jgi:hypothetical protein
MDYEGLAHVVNEHQKQPAIMISIRKPEEQYDAEESCCIQLTMTVI